MEDLVPEINFIDQLMAGLGIINGRLYDSRFVLDNVLSGQTYYRKSFLDNTMSDLSFYLAILESGAAGFSYYNGQPLPGEVISQLVSRNAVEVLRGSDSIPFPLRVAILDAVYGELNRIVGNAPHQIYPRSGSYREKANFRSQLMMEQLEPGKRVLLVGLVTEFVRDALGRGLQLSISDMSPELIDANVYGIPVVNRGNEWTLSRLADSDAAIVTGAAFSSNTVDSILETAQAHGVELYFYLETGSNFAHYLLSRGVRFVLAEKFPFYDLPGETVFEVYRRDS
jgi:putative heavy-metal chelation protein